MQKLNQNKMDDQIHNQKHLSYKKLRNLYLFFLILCLLFLVVDLLFHFWPAAIASVICLMISLVCSTKAYRRKMKAARKIRDLNNQQ